MAKHSKLQNLAAGLQVFAKYGGRTPRTILYLDDLHLEDALSSEEEAFVREHGWTWEPDFGWTFKL